MKGLRLFLSPFTPDQSGATSVFYGYNGMTIMLDAGGCIGNTCGFDEPRWNDRPGAVFSAALRDIDAILGRDEHFIEKVRKAIKTYNAEFIALVGTPITSIIGTDYKALARLMEEQFNVPVLSVATDGMQLYDAGIEKAYFELFKKFADAQPDETESDGQKSRIGVIGALPLDVFSQDTTELRREISGLNGDLDKTVEVICYGNGDSINDVKCAGNVVKNIVVSPAGVKAAKLLERRFGIPYEAAYPIDNRLKMHIKNSIQKSGGLEVNQHKILIVHQQFFANAVREFIKKEFDIEDVRIASWFKMDKDYSESKDVKLKEEGELRELVMDNQIDIVMGDPLLERLLYDLHSRFIPFPHFAVSGALHEVKEY